MSDTPEILETPTPVTSPETSETIVETSAAPTEKKERG
jgi:hypothetical protein